MPSFMGNIENGRIILNVLAGRPGVDMEPENFRPYRALLDTGATQSGISPRLIEALELEHNGEWTEMMGVHGPADVLTYKMSLVIPIAEGPGAVFVKGDDALEATELSLDPEKVGFDVLLGMDFLHGFHLTIFRNFFILSS